MGPIEFSYITQIGQALNATLKREGNDLVLRDKTQDTVLHKQVLSETSSVRIIGSELDDVLTIDSTDTNPWNLRVNFSALNQSVGGGDKLELKVGSTIKLDLSWQTPGTFNFVTKSFVPGSGNFQIAKLVGTNPDNLDFAGVEILVIDGGELLKYVTPLVGDEIFIEKAGTTSSRIRGKSGGVDLVPLTFSNVTEVALDVGANDGGSNLLTGFIGHLGGKDSDQISLAEPLVASGLKTFTISSGKGADSLFVRGNNFSLPVSGGSLKFDGGDGSDSIFAESATAGGADSVVKGTGELLGADGSKIVLNAVENLRDTPTRPLVVIPGLGASFANKSSIGLWNSTIGLRPDQLDLDPVGGLYVDWLTTLIHSGYRLDSTLFIVNWDWRLPLAPKDASMDGVLSAVTAAGITDDIYQSGVDYLGVALKQASEVWAKEHGGQRPSLVDLVGYDAGGLVARAYMQSPAYGGTGSDGKVLPKVNHFTMVGTPNRGNASIYNVLQDNWTASLDTGTPGLALSFAYQRVLVGGRVTTPQGDISLVTITNDGTLLGTPDPKKFVAQFFQSLSDLVPTYDFIEVTEGGETRLTGLNQIVDRRNNLLLDLNDGQDLLYKMGEVPAGRDLSRFVESIQGRFEAIYSMTTPTITKVSTQTGGAGQRASLATALLASPVGSTDVWYKEHKEVDSGDGWVTRASAVGQFLVDLRLDGKIRVRNILRTDVGSTSHSGLLGNVTVLTRIFEGSSVTPVDGDYSVGAATGILSRVPKEIWNTIQMFLQEPQLSGPHAISVPALIGLFESALPTVISFISSKGEDEPAESGTDPNLIRIPDGAIGLGGLPLAPAIRVDGLFVEFKDVVINKSLKQVSGTIGIGADTIAPVPNSTKLRVMAAGVSGSITLEANVVKDYTIKAGTLQLQILDFIRGTAKDISITPMARGGKPVLSIGTLSAGIPKFGLFGELLGFEVTSEGKVFAVGFGFTTSEGLVAPQVGLGEFFPVDVLGGRLKFSGDKNNNNKRDEGEEFDLTSFDVEVRATLNAKFIEKLPFVPVLQVGTQDLNRVGDEIVFVVNVSANGLIPKEVGPIKLGFKEFKIGPVTLSSLITLGGYKDGVFNPDFGGSIKIVSGLADLKGAAEVQITGDFIVEQKKLKVGAKLGVGFSLKDGLIQVSDALLDFGFEATAVNDGFGYRIDVVPPTGQSTYLNKLTVGLLQVKLGSYLTLQARKTTLDFNAKDGEPMLSFGGNQNPDLNPSTTFDPTLTTEGALSAVFGAGAGPLQGWGGAVGNFAITFSLEFKLLPGFFVQLQVGSGASFGLPKFLPIELRSVTVQFNAGAITNGVLTDPNNFTLIVSGGITESGSWPIFGQFSGLRINVQKFIEGDEIGAIENLNGFSVGIKNVSIGPVKVSGALALGVVSVDVTPNDGVVNPVKSFYFRLGGTFFYSVIGGGIDIVFSQHGPLMATISAGGLVEPTTGFVFGFRDAGFTFGGAPLPSISDPKELLNNPVFHSPTRIDLAEIENRVRNSLVRGVPTWNDGFTLTGTATVTNVYVQGMISGEVTLAANIGLTGPHAGLKILATGSINALGFPLGSASLLMDLTNPLVPRLDLAASLPAPNNPIGFLFPTNATLLATLNTKGIIELPVVGLGVFFKRLAEKSLPNVQGLFDQTLTTIAGALQEDHSQTLSKLLLDADDDGFLTELEKSQIITSAFISDRLIGNATRPGLLLPDFGTALNLGAVEYARRMAKGSVAVIELLPFLIREADNLDAGSLLSALAALVPIMQSAALEGLAAGWQTFDPSLTLIGVIQPVLFGMPLGKPTQEVLVTVNKTGVSLEFEGSIKNLTGPTQLAALLSPLPAGFAGLSDVSKFGLTAKLPSEFLTVLINSLASGTNNISQLNQFLIDSLNPLKGWDVVFSSTMTLFGFKLGTVSGIIFGPQPKDATGTFTPSGLFAKQVVNLDPDGDQLPNPSLLDALVNDTANKIPVNEKRQYDNMMRYGGGALTGCSLYAFICARLWPGCETGSGDE